MGEKIFFFLLKHFVRKLTTRDMSFSPFTFLLSHKFFRPLFLFFVFLVQSSMNHWYVRVIILICPVLRHLIYVHCSFKNTTIRESGVRFSHSRPSFPILSLAMYLSYILLFFPLARRKTWELGQEILNALFESLFKHSVEALNI